MSRLVLRELDRVILGSTGDRLFISADRFHCGCLWSLIFFLQKIPSVHPMGSSYHPHEKVGWTCGGFFLEVELIKWPTAWKNLEKLVTANRKADGVSVASSFIHQHWRFFLMVLLFVQCYLRYQLWWLNISWYLWMLWMLMSPYGRSLFNSISFQIKLIVFECVDVSFTWSVSRSPWFWPFHWICSPSVFALRRIIDAPVVHLFNGCRPFVMMAGGWETSLNHPGASPFSHCFQKGHDLPSGKLT